MVGKDNSGVSSTLWCVDRQPKQNIHDYGSLGARMMSAQLLHA